MQINKCFGIISWLPDKEPARQQRKDRLNRLLKQLNELWPTVDILIVAQNWKKFKPVKTTNKLVIKSFADGLGILKARKTLRLEFLKSQYDYIIMLDDDALINATADSASRYIEAIDTHIDGFCFIHRRDKVDVLISERDMYAPAQLNLCAVSKKIFEAVDFPDIDPQKNQGFEDHIFSVLLHNKFAASEFLPPADIYCTQFQNSKAYVPSTWANKSNIKQNTISDNTNKIVDYIIMFKELPNIELFNTYGIIVDNKLAVDHPDVQRLIKRAEAQKAEHRTSDGRLSNAYLYW